MRYVVLKRVLLNTSEWAVDFTTQLFLHTGKDNTRHLLGKSADSTGKLKCANLLLCMPILKKSKQAVVSVTTKFNPLLHTVNAHRDASLPNRKFAV